MDNNKQFLITKNWRSRINQQAKEERGKSTDTPEDGIKTNEDERKTETEITVR